MTNSQWAENVILVDADYIDRVAFDLTVNFERMIGRRIPPADLCRWLDCIALDGGLRPDTGATVQVLFLHSGDSDKLRHFQPGHYADELDGKAFRDHIAEFTLHSFPVEEVVTAEAFFEQSLTALCDAAEVKRLMVIGDMDNYAAGVKRICAATDGKDITLFAMEPVTGRGFACEILGYSLMNALGIRAEELG